MIEAIPPTFYGNHPIIALTFYAKHPIIAPTFYKTLKKLLYYQIFIVFVLFGTAIWSCVLLTMADWKALWCKGWIDGGGGERKQRAPGEGVLCDVYLCVPFGNAFACCGILLVDELLAVLHENLVLSVGANRLTKQVVNLSVLLSCSLDSLNSSSAID